MKIKFWGVRGSIPTPLSSSKIMSKIQAVIQRLTPDDLQNQDTKEKFLSQLPKWISGTIGGNTACVQLLTDDGDQILLDAGSGLRCFAKELNKEKKYAFHIFLSHFHWDHIQGLPFFDPLFNMDSEIHLYSPKDGIEQFLFKNQINPPMFPINYQNGCSKNIYFHKISEGKEFCLCNYKVNSKKMFHPNDSFAYSFIDKEGKKFVYATDTELRNEDFELSESNSSFFSNTDILVLDSQYTLEEAVRKQNWGHSAYCYAVDFAAQWNVKKLYLYHHEPLYDDKKIYSILEQARHYAKYTVNYPLEVELAVEENIITI